MGKIKHWLRSMPLRRAFVSLVLVMAVLVAGISAATIFTCVNVQNHILESVTDYQVLPPQETEDEYNLVIADDEQIVPGENGQLVILSTEYQIANLSDTQRVAYYAAKAAVVLVPTLLFVLGTIFCAWMFYSIKLKQPLSLLLQSADRISQSDLDFCLDYPASDEMGELCRAMDTMRAALLKNNQETWAMMEERRKLSASIAHDLRTPITVMKGYTEYLSHECPAWTHQRGQTDGHDPQSFFGNRPTGTVMQTRCAKSTGDRTPYPVKPTVLLFAGNFLRSRRTNTPFWRSSTSFNSLWILVGFRIFRSCWMGFGTSHDRQCDFQCPALRQP